jgi:hypothetical protein
MMAEDCREDRDPAGGCILRSQGRFSHHPARIGPGPARSWKMDDETRSWVLVGHDAINQGALLRQIEEAEANRQTHYYLTYQDRGGVFYEIEFGLMKGSGIGEPV